MNQSKEEQPITLQDVKDWTLGNANEQIKRRIEDDLGSPRSEVKEYMEWVAAASNAFPTPSHLPTPKLVKRDMESMFKTAGGRQRFFDRFNQSLHDETVTDRGRGR